MADTLDDIEKSLRDSAATIRPGKPSTDPPASVGRHWTPAGVVMVLGSVSALSVTLGTVLAPLVNKPDLSGYVKREDFSEALRKERERSEEEVSRGRRKASEAWQACEDLRGQFSGADERLESLETKPKRRR